LKYQGLRWEFFRTGGTSPSPGFIGTFPCEINPFLKIDGWQSTHAPHSNGGPAYLQTKFDLMVMAMLKFYQNLVEGGALKSLDLKK